MDRARKTAAGLVLAAIGPAIVGNAITPFWEDAGLVRIWTRGAAVLSLGIALAWAEHELTPKAKND